MNHSSLAFNERLTSGAGEVSRPPWYQRAPRLAIIGWLIFLVLGLYLIRLWQLQFLEGGSWQAMAKQQQTKEVTLSPSRGVIYDRNGEIMVRNIPAYNVTITPGYLPDDPERERAVLQHLSTLIDVPYTNAGELEQPDYQVEIMSAGRAMLPPYGEPPPPGLLEMVNRTRGLVPYEPIVVEYNVDRDLALLIAQEGGVTMPGVGIQIIPRRRYTHGALTSQVIGFLGAIPQESVAEYKSKGYNASFDRIGYSGLEAQYEENLRGSPGHRTVEKDILGQELRVIEEYAPIPGDNIHLTLDVELQQVAEDALRTGMEESGSPRAVVVALDPQDGQVLSIVSLPTYDNNMFSQKIDMDELKALQNDPHHPFLNHAIADQVPPGSIFKVVPAAAALNEGVINRYTTVNCPGRMLLPNKFAPDDPSLAQPFYCWIGLQGMGGHGPVDVVDAIAQSCDIFFYHVGGGYEPSNFKGLGVDRLATYAREFGLGKKTGIDIPGEQGGLVPTREWKRENYHETWTTGNTYNLSIGQGDLLATPLQMANIAAAVANGGHIYRPQVVHHIADADDKVIREFKPDLLHKIELPETIWQIVREGMVQATAESGTGWRAQPDPEVGVWVAGKTGTAEYCDNIAYKAGRCDVAEGETLPTHAWFMGYAPAEAPEIVVVAWLYDGGEGSTVAAPVVHEVMDFYFRRKLGIPKIEEGEEGESESAPVDSAPTESQP